MGVLLLGMEHLTVRIQQQNLKQCHTTEILFFLSADMVLTYWALFQCHIRHLIIRSLICSFKVGTIVFGVFQSLWNLACVSDPVVQLPSSLANFKVIWAFEHTTLHAWTVVRSYDEPCYWLLMSRVIGYWWAVLLAIDEPCYWLLMSRVIGYWWAVLLATDELCYWLLMSCVIGYWWAMLLAIDELCYWLLMSHVIGYWWAMLLAIDELCYWLLMSRVIGYWWAVLLATDEPCYWLLKSHVIGYWWAVLLAIDEPCYWLLMSCVIGYWWAMLLVLDEPCYWLLMSRVIGSWWAMLLAIEAVSVLSAPPAETVSRCLLSLHPRTPAEEPWKWNSQNISTKTNLNLFQCKA